MNAEHLMTYPILTLPRGQVLPLHSCLGRVNYSPTHCFPPLIKSGTQCSFEELCSLGQCGSMVRAPSRAPKGCWFHPRSGGVREATNQCFYLPLPSFLSRLNKKAYPLVRIKQKKKNCVIF